MQREIYDADIAIANHTKMKFFSEFHSGDLNKHSGPAKIPSFSVRNRHSHRSGIRIHIAPESLFTCRGIRTPLEDAAETPAVAPFAGSRLNWGATGLGSLPSIPVSAGNVHRPSGGWRFVTAAKMALGYTAIPPPDTKNQRQDDYRELRHAPRLAQGTTGVAEFHRFRELRRNLKDVSEKIGHASPREKKP
jgi:hypothetical protein